MTALAVIPVGEIRPLLERLLAVDDAGVEEPAVFLLGRWAMLDPHGALAFYRERKGKPDMGPQMAGAILTELGKKDLPAAKAALESLEGPELAIAEVMITRGLRERDPEAALAFARERGNGNAERQALLGMAKTNPLAAAEGTAAATAAGAPQDPEVVKEIASSLLAGDRKTFDAWVNGLADPNDRGMARGREFLKESETDPAGAAARAGAWMAAEPEAAPAAVGSDDLTALLAERWIKAGGRIETVAAWAAGLPTGRPRDTAIVRAGRAWLEEDVTAASVWLGGLPRSEGRDRLALDLVTKIGKERPEDALPWALSIEAGENRMDALMSVFGKLGLRDLAAAEALAATLPEKDQEIARDGMRIAGALRNVQQ